MLEYWKQKWIEAGANYALNKNTEAKNIQIWNESSKSYDETLDNRRIEIISKLKNDYINKDSVVLDLGCGTGFYSIELSKICKEVHALDYSDGMLEILNKKIEASNIDNIKVLKKDWNKIDLKSENMYKKYDFVMCSLNPGCYNPDSLLKINEASKRGCCYIGTKDRGQNKMLDKADELFLGEKITGSDISNIIYPFNILYYSGYCPNVFYSNCDWTSKSTYQEGVEKLVKRYKSYREIDKEQIEDFVKNNLENDLFIDKSEKTLGVIHWTSSK